MGEILTVREHNEKGFTFLELLLVLSVVSILTGLVIPIGNKWVQKTSEKEAIQLLVSTIHSMQSYAMAHEITTIVEFVKDGDRTKYKALTSGNLLVSETYLPEGMRISRSSYLDKVEFHPNGDIINFGKLTLITTSGIVEIKFQFQRGRVIIGESERLFMAGDNPYTRVTYSHIWNASPTCNKNNIGTA